MFEKAEGCITLFKSKDTISADNCMELISSVLMDVFKQNGVKNISGLRVENSEKFLTKMSSVLSALSGLYGANEKEVSNFSYAEKFKALEAETEEHKKILANIVAEIDRLQMAQEAEKADFSAQKAGLDSQIAQINGENANLQAELKRLTDELAEKTAFKEATESNIADKKDRITVFEKWKTNLDEETKQIVEEFNRITSMACTFQNIWNAADNQSFLQDTLFRDKLVHDAKDFRDIFPRLNELKDELLEGLHKDQEKLKDVIKKSEKLTEKQ
jgi:DNA repair exonuclease SbcCD ATPase subunit